MYVNGAQADLRLRDGERRAVLLRPRAGYAASERFHAAAAQGVDRGRT